MSVMKIEPVPYELTDTPPRKRGPSSACEASPGRHIPLSKVPLGYCNAVDPKERNR